jgi:16S rRNA (uracil1498-N3)-methyltransferase
VAPPVFWSPSLAGDVVRLEGAEGHHASVVRRLRVGERVRLADGAGAVADGVVCEVHKRTVDVAVAARRAVPRPVPRLTVVQAVPKRERAELTVQALTEVGVDRVVPWVAGRSQVRTSGERGKRLVAKWRAWAHEASKQSRRAWFCEVADVATTAEASALLQVSDLPLVLHEDAESPLAVDLRAADVVLVVGPEGGITPDELDALGTAPVRLGDTVLRTSTAGVVAAGVVLAATRWR